MSGSQNIYVVDNDPAIRHGLHLLLTAAGFHVESFASASDFLADKAPKRGCLIVDVGMPGVNWLEFRIELGRRNYDLAVLVITSRGEVPKVIAAMRAGAIDFIEKPFNGEEIVASIRRALDIGNHDHAAEMDAAKAKIARLTARERSVAEKLAMGKSNKVVAYELGISPRTVEVHRASLMRKLEIENTLHLVRLVLMAWGLMPKGDVPSPPRRGAELDHWQGRG
jgi:two-component system response regulator FixJ